MTFTFTCVAILDHVGGAANATLSQFRDVNQPVTRAKEVHERAEIGGLDHLAVVNPAQFRLGHNAR
jgi:hypothetical protein